MNRPNIIAKLTNFGLAKDVGKRMEAYKSVQRNCVFHMRYTAPEGFDGKFSTKSDVWSFGVLTWELYTLMDKIRRQPISNSSLVEAPVPYSHASTQAEILEELQNGDRLSPPESMPAELRILMNPESRPEFDHLAYA